MASVPSGNISSITTQCSATSARPQRNTFDRGRNCGFHCSSISFFFSSCTLDTQSRRRKIYEKQKFNSTSYAKMTVFRCNWLPVLCCCLARHQVPMEKKKQQQNPPASGLCEHQTLVLLSCPLQWMKQSQHADIGSGVIYLIKRRHPSSGSCAILSFTMTAPSTTNINCAGPTTTVKAAVLLHRFGRHTLKTC